MRRHGLILGGHPVGLRGAGHDVVNGLLLLGRGAENRAAVFIHHLKPFFDMGRALVELGFAPICPQIKQLAVCATSCSKEYALQLLNRPKPSNRFVVSVKWVNSSAEVP